MAPQHQAKHKQPEVDTDKDAVVVVTGKRISPLSSAYESSDASSQDERSSPSGSTSSASASDPASSAEQAITSLLAHMNISQPKALLHMTSVVQQQQQVPAGMPYVPPPTFYSQQVHNMVPVMSGTPSAQVGGTYEANTAPLPVPAMGWQCPPPSHLPLMPFTSYAPPPQVPTIISMAPAPTVHPQQLSPQLYSPVPLVSPGSESVTFQQMPQVQYQQLPMHQQYPMVYQATPTSYQATPTSYSAFPTHQLVTSTETRYTPLDIVCCDPLSLSQRMDVVWNVKFAQLFSFLSGTWSFLPADDLPPSSAGWQVLVDHAKVRFLCRECSAGWTSMKGRVAFWIKFDAATGVGEVMFKLYGQTCRRCEERRSQQPVSASLPPLEYQHSMWYVEEVHKVLENLFHQVGVLFYGFPSSSTNIRHDCRAGKPRKPHDKNLCQACKDGVCRPQH